jgi:hypothetical protein
MHHIYILLLSWITGEFCWHHIFKKANRMVDALAKYRFEILLHFHCYEIICAILFLTLMADVFNLDRPII